MNIYAGRQFGWNWQQHIGNGYLGGDDMVAVPGEDILAPVSGLLTRTANTATITEADGWKTQALELGSTAIPRIVKVGDKIGTAGVKWVHWHSLTPQKVRVPARFLTPPLVEGIFMALTDAQQIDMYNKVNSVFNALFNITPPEWAASGTQAGVWRIVTAILAAEIPAAPTPDYAAIAKAVNDDAAKRLAS